MSNFSRFSLVSAIASLMLIGAGCANTAPAPQPSAPAPTTVNTPTAPAAAEPSAQNLPARTVNAVIANFSFSPGNILANVGNNVVWTNNDSVAHTITADDGSFNSGPIAPGTSYTHVFSTAGIVQYHCSIHTSMHGVVTVSP